MAFVRTWILWRLNYFPHSAGIDRPHHQYHHNRAPYAHSMELAVSNSKEGLSHVYIWLGVYVRFTSLFR